MTDQNADRWAQIRYDYEHTGRPVADICAEHGISANTLRDRVRRWGWTKRRAPIPHDGPPAVVAHRHAAAADFTPFVPAQAGTQEHESPRNEGTFSPTPALPVADDGNAGAAPQAEPARPYPGPRLLGETRSALLRGDEREHDGPLIAEPSAPADADPATIAPRLQSAVARVLPAIEAIIARLSAQPLKPRELEQTARALGALTRTLRELNTLLAQQPLQAAEPYDDMPEDMDAFRNALAERIRIFCETRAREIPDPPPEAAPEAT
ncbi:MAG TPA: hypothetical protein VFW22_01860 [Pseudolabrys sp.]|nr:hypothetical protein [Pseudolabrys sp.]